jgi:6-pyruvoyltetrahydropterin/6-carboxytetrahydropterin synthase
MASHSDDTSPLRLPGNLRMLCRKTEIIMIIQKEYRFYAAHRNETLADKCSNLHGHRYGLRCFFEVERDGDISTLFGTFDDRMEPWLKENYDHGMLINMHDPLYETLLEHCRRMGENFKLKVFDGPTSVENLAWMMFSEITEMGFRLSHIEVRETDSSVISYSREDWIRDNRYFATSRIAGQLPEKHEM